jgi:hypothetical protein
MKIITMTTPSTPTKTFRNVLTFETRPVTLMAEYAGNLTAYLFYQQDTFSGKNYLNI